MAVTARVKGRTTRGIKPGRGGKRTPERDLNLNHYIGSVWQDRVKTVGPPETGPGEAHVLQGTEAPA